MMKRERVEDVLEELEVRARQQDVKETIEQADALLEVARRREFLFETQASYSIAKYLIDVIQMRKDFPIGLKDVTRFSSIVRMVDASIQDSDLKQTKVAYSEKDVDVIGHYLLSDVPVRIGRDLVFGQNARLLRKPVYRAFHQLQLDFEANGGRCKSDHVKGISKVIAEFDQLSK